MVTYINLASGGDGKLDIIHIIVYKPEIAMELYVLEVNSLRKLFQSNFVLCLKFAY